MNMLEEKVSNKIYLNYVDNKNRLLYNKIVKN